MAVWFARVGRLNVATVLDGYFNARTKEVSLAHYQATVDQLNDLLAPDQFIAERARGTAMSLDEITAYLHDELGSLSVDRQADEATTR